MEFRHIDTTILYIKKFHETDLFIDKHHTLSAISEYIHTI